MNTDILGKILICGGGGVSQVPTPVVWKVTNIGGRWSAPDGSALNLNALVDKQKP